MNPDAGTIAAFYYKAVRTYDLPHRDIYVAPQQDHKFTVEQFDVRLGGTVVRFAAGCDLDPGAPLQRNVYAYAKGFVDGLNLKAGDKVALWLTNETENVRGIALCRQSAKISRLLAVRSLSALLCRSFSSSPAPSSA